MLPFDGWLLLLGGRGCYLRFGKDCNIYKRAKDRKTQHYFDIPWLTTDVVAQVLTVPSIEKTSDIIKIRRENRQNTLLSSMPLLLVMS